MAELSIRHLPFDRVLKIIVIGNSESRKSTILYRYSVLQGSIGPRGYTTTIGIDFATATVKINEEILKLQIWDTAGQERFRYITSSYFRGAQGVMVVYSVCDMKSFIDCTTWMQEIDKYAASNVSRILVGHKYCEEGDYTEAMRVVPRHDAEEFAKHYGLSFCEVDSQTGENIEGAFLTLAKSAVNNQPAIQMLLKSKRRNLDELKEENTMLTSRIHQVRRSIEAMHKREKAANKKERENQKKALKLDQQIDKKHSVIQTAMERVAEATYKAYRAEQSLKEQREHMEDLVLRVREIEGRVSGLQEQLRRAEGGATGKWRRPFWVVDPEEIEWREEHGKGTFGTGHVAMFRGLNVAATYVHSDSMVSDYNQVLYSREISIAATIRHPNIVQFIGATLEGYPIILTELMATTLKVELVKLSPDQISSISLDVARALLYMHQMKPDPIIHRDVSSVNVLLNPGPKDSWLAKLSNCGSANYLCRILTQSPGNPVYAAPEANTPPQHSTKMDVFSYGVLLLEMWCQHTPELKGRQAMLHGLERGDVREMVRRCLQHNPTRRPGMADLLQELQ